MARFPSFAGFRSPAARPGRRLAVLALALGLTLAGCESDTIYDPDLTGPSPSPGEPPSGSARGQYVPLPSPGVIADAVVDTLSRNFFLSNRSTHRVEVLDLDALVFRAAIPVGSQPWGLAMNRTGDTLIVANSGGINVSFVPTADLVEDVEKRFEIPRVTLYEIRAGERFVLQFYNYADRPQHVTQDSEGRLLYSAISTQAAPIGTIRKAEWKPGWETWDASLLFADGSLANTPPVTHRAVTAPGGIAIANVDSMTLVFDTVGPVAFYTGQVVMFDHVPGLLPSNPQHLIQSDTLPFREAVDALYSRGSDVLIYPGFVWNFPESVAMADTTFVAASGDRGHVIFGELTDDRAGRLMVWSAEIGGLSRVDDIADIVNNTSDRITGVDLNFDGSLGMARGMNATYFFGTDLRLQGLSDLTNRGGAGAALLPNSTGPRTLAFLGSGSQSIRIVETTHYTVVGEIPIRGNIVGPLRVAPSRTPASACPANFREGPADCVVATVYGVTDARQVLVLDVLQSDIAEVQ